MAKVKEVFDIIDAAAPFHSAMDFDNVGILVGSGETEVTRALLALDITPEVVREARDKNANLIISHHPVIFHPLRSLEAESVPYLLARYGITALCCHTNLDLSPVCGVNLALAQKLNLQEVRGEEEYGEGFLLYSGVLPAPMDTLAFAVYVKDRLGAESVSFFAGNRPVSRVFLCSGAGGEYAAQAAMLGADAFVTGEMKHSEMLEARASGITAVAAGHYETEKCFADMLAAYLRRQAPGLSLIQSRTETTPFASI